MALTITETIIVTSLYCIRDALSHRPSPSNNKRRVLIPGHMYDLFLFGLYVAAFLYTSHVLAYPFKLGSERSCGDAVGECSIRI